VHGEDVRCFAGNSGISKVNLCHKTGSTKNPCVAICVDASAVAEHLAHGDAYGACPKNGCGTVQTQSVNGETTYAAIAQRLPTEQKIFNAKIANNPNFGGSEFALAIEGSSNEDVHIIVTNMYGAKVFSAKGAANQTYRFGSGFTSGTYIVQVIQGKNIKTIKVIKGEG